jgi:hypothetical protein
LIKRAKDRRCGSCGFGKIHTIPLQTHCAVTTSINKKKYISAHIPSRIMSREESTSLEVSQSTATDSTPSENPHSSTLWENDPPGYIREGIEAMKLALAADAADQKAEQEATAKTAAAPKGPPQAGAAEGVSVKDFAVFKEPKPRVPSRASWLRGKLGGER